MQAAIVCKLSSHMYPICHADFLPVQHCISGFELFPKMPSFLRHNNLFVWEREHGTQCIMHGSLNYVQPLLWIPYPLAYGRGFAAELGAYSTYEAQADHERGLQDEADLQSRGS